MLPISFSQTLRRQPIEDQVHAITMRSGVQLLKITIKKKGSEENQVPIRSKVQVVWFEELVKVNQEEGSNNLHVKAIIIINQHTLPILFRQRWKNKKLEK